MKLRDFDLYRSNDTTYIRDVHDTRKPKLTLKHLNKLRKIKELRSLEKYYQDEQLELIFGLT